MKKIGAFLLGAVFAVLFSAPGAFAGSGGEKPTALGALTSLSPSPSVPDVPPATAVPSPRCDEFIRAIEPGSDLAPKVEDAVRVKAILKLVSDIYYNVQLPYSQDGTTFTNKEKRLPPQPLGFYKEYTLITGDAPHTVVIGGKTYKVAPDQGKRGSERVVIGGGSELYYSPDHYVTFIRLTVIR